MAVYLEPVRADFWQLYREPDGSYLDPLGPKNCTTHSMSRAIMRHFEGARPPGITGVWPPTGYAIRRYTGDAEGGTNLGQMAVVGRNYYGMELEDRYRMGWDAFLGELEETRGAILQLRYKRIRDHSVFRGSFTFTDNHAIWVSGVDRERGVATGVVDPLADGRAAGIFRGPADYPLSLLRAAAGELNISTSGYRALGYGLVYAGFTRATGLPPGTTAPEVTMNVLDGRAVNAILTSPVQRVAARKGARFYDKVGGRVIDTAPFEIRIPLLCYPATGWRGVMITTRGGNPSAPLRTIEAFVDKDDVRLL